MSQQIDKKKTMQVRIDASLHYYAKVKAAEQGRTLRGILDELLCEWLGSDIDQQQNT